MKKLQLASAIIIPALLTSNIILTFQYKHDINKYEHRLHNQSKIIKQSKLSISKLTDSVRSKSLESNILHKQLDQSTNENGKLKKRLNNIFHYNITAYSPYFESTGKTIGDADYKVTASGERVREGVSVACPPSLEFGTKLYIQNIGLRVCDDRGGKIKSNHLDIYFDTVQDAIKFGRKMLKVEILN